jgi:hypothetical protein
MKELDLLKKIGKRVIILLIKYQNKIYKMIHKKIVFDCEVDFDYKHFGEFYCGPV